MLRSTAYEKLLPPLVAKVREEVYAWRNNGYPGALCRRITKIPAGGGLKRRDLPARHLSRMKTTTFLAAVAAVFLGIACACADEQNGLSVNVSRKTSDRSATSEGNGTKVRQGLKVEIKNQRLKAMPAGELQWTVVVKKRYSSLEKHKGKEVLKALKPGEVSELVVGNFGLATVREYEAVAKDKIEYEIVIRHEGKETYRFSTASDFAALAKEATLVERKTPEEIETARLAAAEAAKPAIEPKLEADPGRLSVNVSRKTLDTRGPEPDTSYGGTVTRKKQTFKLDLKNVGIKPLPPGEIRWTVLVKGRGSLMTKYEGVEPIKALRSVEAIAAQVGEFTVASYKTEYAVSKGDIEYRIVVVHDGKETYRFSTVADFATLAKAATPLEKKEGVAKVADAKPAVPAVPVPVVPGAPAMPGNAAATPKQPAPPEPVVTRPPVDFFNLGGK